MFTFKSQAKCNIYIYISWKESKKHPFIQYSYTKEDKTHSGNIIIRKQKGRQVFQSYKCTSAETWKTKTIDSQTIMTKRMDDKKTTHFWGRFSPDGQTTQKLMHR